MNAKDKYNEIIDFIETTVSECVGEKSTDIVERVIKEKGRGTPIRDMNAIMIFLTGDAIRAYVAKRQMMKAYEYLTENPNSDIDTAISFTGHSDHPTFTKAFRRQFNMTPTEVRGKRDYEPIKPPMRWDVISTDEQLSPSSNEEENVMAEAQIFGISIEKYKRLMSAMDFKALYGFDDYETELAFVIDEKYGAKYGIEMRDAFEFVDEMSMQRNVYEESEENYDRNLLQSFVDKLEPMLFIYFKLKMSVAQANNILYELDRQGVDDFMNDEIEIFLEYLKYSIPYKTVRELYSYYMLNSSDKDDFELFMLAVSTGEDPEVALSTIEPTFDSNPDFDPIEEGKRVEAEILDEKSWEGLIEDYRNTERFEHEPDMDNLAYEEDDDSDEYDFGYELEDYNY